MGKKYNQEPNENEDNKISEPTSEYQRTNDMKYSLPLLNEASNSLEEKKFPCEFTSEEKWAILEQARKDEITGNFVSQDQVMDRYKSRFS